MKNILQLLESMGTRKKLGFPSMIDKKKKSNFGFSRDRVWRIIQQLMVMKLVKGMHMSSY
jgi:hypothetical protein